MSKIVCDVCGTSFADSATQCPICGCAVSAENVIINAPTTDEDPGHGSYTYVKGGRFSKSNVKKRNSGKHVALNEHKNDEKPEKPEKKKSNKGLAIACIALFLAIVAVVLYFFIFVMNDRKPADDKNTTPSTTNQPDEDPVDDPVDEEIPCEEITLSAITLELTEAGQVAKLDVTVGPEDCTQKPNFMSDNEAVATVDAEGNITAVAPGNAVITVTCGEFSALCEVSCTFEATEETDQPDAPNNGEEENAEEDASEEQNPTTTGENSNHLLKENKLTLKVNGSKLSSFEADGTPSFTLYHPDFAVLELLDENGNALDISIKSGGEFLCQVNSTQKNRVDTVEYIHNTTLYCTLQIRYGDGENDFVTCRVYCAPYKGY